MLPPTAKETSPRVRIIRRVDDQRSLSSAYAGGHGLGRGGMRDFGNNYYTDIPAVLRRISPTSG